MDSKYRNQKMYTVMKISRLLLFKNLGRRDSRWLIILHQIYSIFYPVNNNNWSHEREWTKQIRDQVNQIVLYCYAN